MPPVTQTLLIANVAVFLLQSASGGLLEGNHLFQVVWLSDEQRDDCLARVRRLGQERNLRTQQIVFEGNAPSDAAKNPLLREHLVAATWPQKPPLEAAAWLGEAVAIKDPTAAVFRSQSGNNLLIVGQNGEAAQGILATCDTTRYETLEDLDSWVESVFRTVGEIPVAFAINKADLKDQAAFGEEQIKLATEGFDAPWFHVSAKTGNNVEGLFRALAGTIAQNALGK